MKPYIPLALFGALALSTNPHAQHKFVYWAESAPWLRTIPVEAAYVRPRVYGGDEATSITVTAVFGRPGR